MVTEYSRVTEYNRVTEYYRVTEYSRVQNTAGFQNTAGLQITVAGLQITAAWLQIGLYEIEVLVLYIGCRGCRYRLGACMPRLHVCIYEEQYFTTTFVRNNNIQLS